MNNLKSITLTIFAVLLLNSCAPKDNTISLFDGKTLKGWSAWNREGGATDNALERFAVEDGMIRMHGENGGYLKSDNIYSDFELTLEFRWNIDSAYIPQKPERNSGVMYNVLAETPDSWFPRGIQYQVQTEKTGDFILLKEATLDVKGETYGPGASVVITRSADAILADGEWNKVRIVSHHGELQHYLNGVLVNQGTNCSEASGRILLCYETAPIDFKNIELKPFH